MYEIRSFVFPMKHSNREIPENERTPVAQPVQVKAKRSFYAKIKTGCCFVFIVLIVAGGLYLYKFYQDVKAEIDSEIEDKKNLYNNTKDTIDKANENYQEINSAIEQGREYIEKIDQIKDGTSN